MDFPLTKDTYDTVRERMAYVPENYMSSIVTGVETGPALDVAQLIEQSRKPKPRPIWKLQTKTRIFSTPKPILVKIYRDGGLFFAENENLVVCGTGNTPRDALEDLCIDIIYFFEYYRDLDESQLIGDAIRLKQLYQNLLLEEQYAG